MNGYEGPLTPERVRMLRPAQWGHVRLSAVDTQLDIWLLGLIVTWGMGTVLFWIVLAWCVILTLRWIYLADAMGVNSVSLRDH